MTEDVPPVAGTRPRATRWFHELTDELSFVDGSAVGWLPRPGEFAWPLVLPRQRLPADGYGGRPTIG